MPSFIALDNDRPWRISDLEVLVLGMVGGGARSGAHSPESAQWWSTTAWRFIPQQTVDAFVAASTAAAAAADGAQPSEIGMPTGFVRAALSAIASAVQRIEPGRDPMRVVRRIDGELRRAYAQIAVGAKVRLIRVLSKMLDAALASEAAATMTAAPVPTATVPSRPTASTNKPPAPRASGATTPHDEPWAQDTFAARIASICKSAAATAPPPFSSTIVAVATPAAATGRGGVRPCASDAAVAAATRNLPPLTQDDVARAVTAQRSMLRGAVVPSAPSSAQRLAAIDAAADLYLRDSEATATAVGADVAAALGSRASAAGDACPLRIPRRACFATRVTAADVKAMLAYATVDVRDNVLHTATLHACAPPAVLERYAGPPPPSGASAALSLKATPPPPPEPSRFGPPAAAAAPAKTPTAPATPSKRPAAATALDRFVRQRRA